MTTQSTAGPRGYTALLRPADHRVLVTAGLLARVPLAIVGFSVLFFVQATTGSFASAGVASGVVIAANAASAPLYGRLADRRGQRALLLTAAIGHPVAIAALIVVGTTGGGLLAVCGCVLAVGATIVPVGAFLRARWTSILPSDDQLHVAYSLEAISDELVWVFGPAVAALVAGTISPSAGLVLSGVVGTVGCLWLRAGRDAPLAAAPAEGERRHVFAPWRSRRVVALLVSGAFVGFVFGVNDVTVVAWATDAGVPQIAGLVLTAYSIGSVTGGFLMGTIPARIPPYRLLIGASALLGIFWSVLALAPDVAWLFPLGLFAGATITPFTISTNRVLQAEVAPSVLTEGLAWVSAFVVGSMAVGSLVGGVVNDGSAVLSGFQVVALAAPLPFVVVGLVAVLPRARARRVA
ncbi:hypothetical protein AS850_01075 [Frondihabitans sp. 762G35]|uniref:MFS transporter n=1 Tax=Frondihabitans sp. 762G35 TaxID=1446794 RepID=UPI000D22ABF4|nr:MFS transporter [Frondihabitans sp. 762G35]ARC55666.1 hypothetical protein AS850_01075 [Frondihabitans sp. 762G35]